MDVEGAEEIHRDETRGGMRFNMKENDAISIVELYADRNSGKMVSEIATKEKELEMLREIISLRKTVYGLVESLSEVQKKAKADLEIEKYNSEERHRETISRLGCVLWRDQGNKEDYMLARITEEGIEYAFTFDGYEMMEWISDWKGSTHIDDIPDELEGFRASFISSLRDGETERAISATRPWLEEKQNTDTVLDDMLIHIESDQEYMERVVNKMDEEKEPVCMDEAGIPTTFTRKCNLCGEEGRNSRTHKEEPISVDGRMTHHWI